MKVSRQGLTVAAAFLALTSQAGATGADSNAPASEVATASSERIPQPSLDMLDEVTRRRLAPESQRVDLNVPTFTHPTNVTNPLFPISDLHAALLVGKFEGKPWRAETTLLPDTRTVEWNGKKIETLQSQFVAYLSDGSTNSQSISTRRPTTDPFGTSVRTRSATREAASAR